MLGAAHEGEVAFVAEVLARRAAIPTEAAIDELLSGEPRFVMALLRAADVSRDLAAGLLASIGDLIGIADAGAAITLFDGMTDAEVQVAHSWLVTNADYRAALDRMGQGRG